MNSFDKRFEDELDEPQPLPIDHRLAIQMSYGTIRTIIDAIVELVTNSDDSYRLLEQEVKTVDGKIIINVERHKGGKCNKLEVIDFAAGMEKDKLKKALRFASEESGFREGKSVRGLFGRGLKEAIFALGKAEIFTIKDNYLSCATLWHERNNPMYRPPKESHVPSKEERQEIGIQKGNGTVVRINVTNDKIKCPALKTLFPQICNHYALRDINKSQKRKIQLCFQSPKEGKLFNMISYDTPEGQEKIKQAIKLPKYGDEIQILIYESKEELESPYNDPFARAGLLIKSEDAILDNQLFRYQSERAGRFFYGEVIWPNLANRLRKDEPLLDLNRSGIEWQQEICLILQNEVERFLAPLIEEKKRNLIKPSGQPSEKITKLNRAMCSLLNKLAKEHLSELPPGPEPDELIDDLIIKPPYANIELNKVRAFSVYAPMNILVKGTGIVSVESDNLPHILALTPTVSLERHRKFPTLYYGYFKVVGKKDGEEATITCKLQDHIATTTVRVAPPKEKATRPEKPTGTGGYFRGIEPDRDDKPEQRVRYDGTTCIIWICVNFPGIQKYFDENLNFSDEFNSKLMYAELIGEAFCKFTARLDIEHGKIPIMGNTSDAWIEAYIKSINNSQKKFLHTIHEAVLKYKL